MDAAPSVGGPSGPGTWPVVSTDISGNLVFYQLAMARNHESRILALTLHSANCPSSWLWPSLKGLVRVSEQLHHLCHVLAPLFLPMPTCASIMKWHHMVPTGQVSCNREGEIPIQSDHILFNVQFYHYCLNTYWLLLLKIKWARVVIMHSTGTNHFAQKQTGEHRTNLTWITCINNTTVVVMRYHKESNYSMCSWDRVSFLQFTLEHVPKNRSLDFAFSHTEAEETQCQFIHYPNAYLVYHSA